MKKGYKTDVALMSVTNTEFGSVMHFHTWQAETNDGTIKFTTWLNLSATGKNIPWFTPRLGKWA